MIQNKGRAVGKELANREINEYLSLCATFGELQKKFLERKLELRQTLKETAALKKKALLLLSRANRLTRHLTGRQRQIAGLAYHAGEITARLHKVNQSSLVLLHTGIQETETIPLLKNDCENRAELRRKGVTILAMIDRARKNLLELDILELRCRELILSINKALEAFRHEYRNIRRNIYPFGMFSLFLRSFRRLWGRTYFSLKDLEEVGALGKITGYVLKIADSF